MTLRPSPTLPRRLSQAERAKIVHALRARATVMLSGSRGSPRAIADVYRKLADEYTELADRIRDGGPLVQQAYYGIRISRRERRDNRKDRA